ncbi:hypothetical protein DN92_04125 [Polynucleobacter arcticus]|uniref:Uncharacterized protein n=1 Tax=Polynucleobacter arcticus TaxID=1743165 RepID=A0A6M9PU89_9BURK|nr:hypothetical protein DN92_04125 [Polynucleobacter arcticus]
MLLLCASPALASEFLILTCERTEKNYTEVYEFKILPASKTQKAKVLIDGRDLDRSDEMGHQAVKSIVVTESTILISMEAHFPPENFDGVQYGSGSVMTVTTINRSTGQLRKVETIRGGILSTTVGEGTKIYQEQCVAPKKL